MPFKVFIGYGDVPAARKATSTIADTLFRTGRHVELRPMLWRFNQLTSSHWRDRAIAAAVEADVVVLASSTGGALAPAIDDWVGALLAATRGRRTTLVAISGSDAWTISIEQPLTAVLPEVISTAAWQGRSVAA